MCRPRCHPSTWSYPAAPISTSSGQSECLALVIMAGLREEIELTNVPKLVRGVAMSFFIAGILSMAFMGFAGVGA